MVNDKTVLRAVKRRERTERLLYYADFTDACWQRVSAAYGIADQLEFKRKEGFFLPETLFPKRREDAPEFEYSGYFKDVQIPDGVKISGEGALYMPGSSYHFTHLISPLRDVYDFEEIKKFPIYRKKEYYGYSHYRGQAETAHERGAAVQAWVGRFFETAWPLRGYENMLADMAGEPEIAEYFLDAETEFNLAAATAAARAGADMLVFGDDVGSQTCMTFSAELWRSMFKPRFEKVFKAARAIKPDIILWYHSCGHITEIIPDLIEIGLDILNPIQPESMDIWEIHKNFKGKLSFDGGLGTQSVLPFGSPKDVTDTVRRLAETFGENGGLILSPSHILEPEVPIDNIKAFIDAAHKYCT
ncbi:hypothetical protein FACS1894211_13370 [Clostridia bacterium]|nr:hypothetical protein FACS1894211_13370 [Clostridia bacterium]